MSEVQGLFDSTTPVVMLNPTLFEPKPYLDPKTKKPKGEPKFSGRFVFQPDHPDVATMKTKALAVARAEWPGVEPKDVNFPFKNGIKAAAKIRENKGNEKVAEFIDGKVLITARSKFQPVLSIFQGGKAVDLEGPALAAAKSKFYAGTDVLIELNFVAQEVDEKKSVTAYLNKVLTLNRGERRGGGRTSAEAFKGYVGSTVSEDPTSGDLDDEIPF